MPHMRSSWAPPLGGGCGLRRSESTSGLDSGLLSRKNALGRAPPRLPGGQRAAS